MMVDMTDVPCGERLQFAIEHGPAEIVNFPMNSMVIFIVMFVYQRVNIPTPWSIWVLTNK